MRVWRQTANRISPPQHKAAEALSLRDLQELWRRAGHVELTSREAQALDILTLAFASMSRVAEIATLRTENVAPDGAAISIRPKTKASTQQRCSKHISNGHGLYPRDILAARRGQAVDAGRGLLFSAAQDRDAILDTASITSALKTLVRRVGLGVRVTSHSARKGAAVTALLGGVPVVVIQAFGAWASTESLQYYLAKAVRENFCVLDMPLGGR